jgi:hypothetical protein
MSNTMGIWDRLIDKAEFDEKKWYNRGTRLVEDKSKEIARSRRTLLPETEVKL